MKLLLLSNSTNAREPYLGWAREKVAQFVSGCKNIAFIPFAGVTVSYSDYELKVQDALAELSIKPVSIHHSENFLKTIAQADAIFAGGGNTFKLVEMLVITSYSIHYTKLYDRIKSENNTINRNEIFGLSFVKHIQLILSPKIGIK